jgi:hypothetical protein
MSLPDPDACVLTDVDGEHVAVMTCCCGTKHEPWSVILSISKSDPTRMPCCGRSFYFSNRVTVHES